MGWKASLPRRESKSRLEEVLLLTSSARAAPQTALEFEGKIFHMAGSTEHYHQMVEKCVKVGGIPHVEFCVGSINLNVNEIARVKGQCRALMLRLAERFYLPWYPIKTYT